MRGHHSTALTLLSVFLVSLGARAASLDQKQDALPALVINEADEKAAPKPSESPSSPLDSQEKDKDREREAASSPEDKLIPYEIGNRDETKVSTTAPTSQADAKNDNQPAAPNNDKDINLLWANKNDAENDLASPSKRQPGDSKADEGDKKSPASELDAPVEVNKPADDRFHYYGVGDSGSTERPTDEQTTRKPTIGAPSKPLDGAPGAEASPAQESSQPSEPERRREPEQAESGLEGKKGELEPNSAPEPEKGTEKSIPGLEKESEPALKPADEARALPEAKSDTPKEASKEVAGEIPKASPKVESKVDAKADDKVDEKVEDKVDNKVDAKVDPKIDAKEQPKVDEAAEKPGKPIPDAKASPPDAPSPGVSSVVVVAAAAAGSAFGAALNPADKDKLPSPGTIATTSKPSSSLSPKITTTTGRPAVSSTRRSSIDRWDRRSTTSTSSPSPSTRRRPFLPSFRRRFRPQNRYSPFPWADPFVPDVGEPEMGESEPPFARPSSSTSRPRVRGGVAPPEETDEVGTRRYKPGNRRRHHHHSSGDSEFGGPRRRPPLGARRDHVGSDEGSSFFDSAFGGPFANSPFASTFNSAFDSLFPAASWPDDDRPYGSRPPYRPRPPGGHRPHDGEYEDEYYGNYDCEHGYRPPHRPPYRPPYRPPPRERGTSDRGGDRGGERGGERGSSEHGGERGAGSGADSERPSIPSSNASPGSSPHPPKHDRRPTSRRESAAGEVAESRRVEPLGRSESVGWPVRVPSIFSPFDSLFGALDDDLFGLRSSYVDSPHAFDTIVSSPKISMPSLGVPEKPSRFDDKPVEARSQLG